VTRRCRAPGNSINRQEILQSHDAPPLDFAD
jgi:hypothetical protein